MSALGTIEVVGAAAPVSDDLGEGSQEPVDYKVKASIFWDEMGLHGFEELRKYIKQGNEFCREVTAIMQERAELEEVYAKGLGKLGTKMSKAAGGSIGTLSAAWAMVGDELEAESKVHKSLAAALAEDIYKPMKTLTETQHKTRKPIEAVVDKSLKSFMDRRNEEYKSKKLSFTLTKEREKLYDQSSNAKSGKIKSSDKEVHKLEKKIRQAEESLKKSDKDYLNACQKAESARQEWEGAVYKGCSNLQGLEEERITHMQEYINKYNEHLSVLGPKIITSCDKLGEAVLSVNLQQDLRTVVDQKSTGPNMPEQILLDCYAEDLNNNMNAERRKQSLQNLMLYLQQEIYKEQKGKEGVQKLVEVYHDRPNFADDEAQEDARQKLAGVNSMLNHLEASYHKLLCAVAGLEGQPKPTHQFGQYIEQTRDKQGMTQSILRLPISIINEGLGAFASARNRGAADGDHCSPPPFDEDEFETYPEPPHSANSMKRCRVIYEYVANQQDELTIKPGDIINIYDKQADGWWQGELQGKVGIFPATYVEDI